MSSASRISPDRGSCMRFVVHYRNIFVIALIAALLVSSCSSQPNSQAEDIYTVGILNPIAILEFFFVEFFAEIEGLGYEEGQTIQYVGSTEAIDDLPDLLTQINMLIEAEVDVIVTAGTEVGLIIHGQDTNIPVVIFGLQDPVGAGLVDDLATPGDHITGIEIGKINAKRLELVVEATAITDGIYVPYRPADFQASRSATEVEAAATLLGVEVVLDEIPEAHDFDTIVAEMPADLNAIFLVEDYVLTPDVRWSQVARERRIPLSMPGTDSDNDADYDVFLGYGIAPRSTAIQIARIVDQVLRGTPPGEIPIEVAETTLSIDLALAQELGITVPDHVVDRADFVFYPDQEAE